MMAEQFVGPCRLTARHGTTSSNLISSSGESVACFGPVIGFFAGYATRSDMSSPPAPKTEPWLLECRSLAQHGTEPSPGPFLGVGRTPPVVLPVTARSALHHRGSPRRAADRTAASCASAHVFAIAAAFSSVPPFERSE